MMDHSNLHTSKSKDVSPLGQGIKNVSIGKKGSKNLTPELAQDIADQLQTDNPAPIMVGAFLGGLMVKGVCQEELILEQAIGSGVLTDVMKLVQYIAHDTPPFIQDICADLLQNKTMDAETAHRVGNFLLSDQEGDGARGLIASILRVRYETIDEYEGFLKSIHESIPTAFQGPVPQGNPIIQIAEPFDGVDHTYMITPIITQYLTQQNYRVISLGGDNSGPKYGNNLKDVSVGLGVPFLKSTSELSKSVSPFGWLADQEDLSPPLFRWVGLRRQIIKRPCWATLERFLNPAHAQFLIVSAFHPPYGEKMLHVAQRAGFPGIIVVRNGMEGTIAFPLKREAKLLCSAQQGSTYTTTEMVIDPIEDLNINMPVEEKLENPSLDTNIQLLKIFAETGKTDNKHFDLRIQATWFGIQKALHWINENLNTKQGGQP